MFHGPLWFESIRKCMKFNNIIIIINKLNLKRISKSTIKNGLWNFATYERAHWALKRFFFFSIRCSLKPIFFLFIHSKSWYEIKFMGKGQNVNWLAIIKAHKKLLLDFIAASHLMIVVDTLWFSSFASAHACARKQFELSSKFVSDFAYISIDLLWRLWKR